MALFDRSDWVANYVRLRVTFTVDMPLQRRSKLTDDCRSLTKAVASLEGA
jgi:hypothetical protein